MTPDPVLGMPVWVYAGEIGKGGNGVGTLTPERTGGITSCEVFEGGFGMGSPGRPAIP